MEQQILNHIEDKLYSDALFLAELYDAEVRTEDSMYMKALCYYELRQYIAAYHILSTSQYTQSKCRLLHGRCCYELGLYHDAEEAFLGDDIKLHYDNIELDSNGFRSSRNASSNNLLDHTLNPISHHLVRVYGNERNAVIVAKLIGSIMEKTSRPTEAAEFYRVCQELSPLTRSPSEALARLGDRTTSSSTRFDALAQTLSKFKIDSTGVKQYYTDNSEIEKSTTTSADAQHDLQHTYKTPATRRAVSQANRREPRRSTRLYSIENNNETPASRPTIAGTQAPAKKIRRIEQDLSLSPIAKVYLDSLKAIECFYQYKLEDSRKIFMSLPLKHLNTAWVSSWLARNYYEATNYDESARYYHEARFLEPYRLTGMEYYSSALWHLHKEVELSKLSKELMETNQSAPESWCVAGNCYSLQKEHETAIRYLERAIKIDPNFAYAYTLLGHELISAERLDQALTCFRSAVRLDPQHWNAWSGLGCIYYKNELYANAEIYYKKALKIAPTNPVLLCQLAVVQHACKRSDEAINTLTQALKIDPDNALCRFHRATIYSAIDRDQEALNELNTLKPLIPKESMVYFLMGKIYKKQDLTHRALMNFSWAMELDPKGANNTIKDVIDKQYPGDDDVVVHRDQCVDT